MRPRYDSIKDESRSIQFANGFFSGWFDHFQVTMDVIPNNFLKTLQIVHKPQFIPLTACSVKKSEYFNWYYVRITLFPVPEYMESSERKIDHEVEVRQLRPNFANLVTCYRALSTNQLVENKQTNNIQF